MKAIIIYSGKGGVGKTTTTANIARLLAKQGNKVFIIDADINTPSMNTEFEGDHPHEMIWVHSSGNMFSKFIYLEKSMVRQYLELAKKKIHSINPDYVLIDTPPSVTNVHIELLSRVKVSYVLFPDEIMPVDINLLQQEINEGYIMLSDGRYLPPKETVQQCYNAFGIRVGLGDNWEDIYDSWNKEMK